MVRFNPADVFSITLKQGPEAAILLSRSGERWQLSGGGEKGGEQRADTDAVLHLLDDLASMEIIRVVTRNPEHYERLQLASGATRVTLKGKDDAILLDLLVGKQGSDLISTYLRIVDKPEVLAVNRVLLWQVKRSYQGWKAMDVPAAGRADKPASQAD